MVNCKRNLKRTVSRKIQKNIQDVHWLGVFYCPELRTTSRSVPIDDPETTVVLPTIEFVVVDEGWVCLRKRAQKTSILSGKENKQ